MCFSLDAEANSILVTYSGLWDSQNLKDCLEFTENSLGFDCKIHVNEVFGYSVKRKEVIKTSDLHVLLWALGLLVSPQHPEKLFFEKS